MRGLSADDEINYLNEFEHLTLARVLIAEYQHNHTERIHPRCNQTVGASVERGRRAKQDGQRNRNPANTSARPPGARGPSFGTGVA